MFPNIAYDTFLNFIIFAGSRQIKLDRRGIISVEHPSGLSIGLIRGYHDCISFAVYNENQLFNQIPEKISITNRF